FTRGTLQSRRPMLLGAAGTFLLRVDAIPSFRLTAEPAAVGCRAAGTLPESRSWQRIRGPLRRDFFLPPPCGGRSCCRVWAAATGSRSKPPLTQRLRARLPHLPLRDRDAG